MEFVEVPFVAYCFKGLPWWVSGNVYTRNVGDMRSIPELGRSLGGGYGNPLQYAYLENPMDRGAWRATVHGVTESRTRLSTHIHVLF